MELDTHYTPVTTTNFIELITGAGNGYTDTVMHRVVPGFIIQGGAYRNNQPNVFAGTSAYGSPFVGGYLLYPFAGPFCHASYQMNYLRLPFTVARYPWPT